MAEEVTVDALLGGRIRLEQPRRGYRVAVDPVLLAAATPAEPGERVLDVGAGVGAASLCLAVRVPGARVLGLELQEELVRLAARNVVANGLDGRVEVVAGDLMRPPAACARGSFDRVMANPPFLKPGAHTPPPHAGRALAHGEGEAVLADWIDFCAAMVRPRGTVTLVHRADRVDELLAALHGRFGAVTLYPLWPRAGREAKRVLVTARRGVRSPARLSAGLVLHGEDGRFTPAAEAILRGDGGLPP